jgi:hypothetical protein
VVWRFYGGLEKWPASFAKTRTPPESEKGGTKDGGTLRTILDARTYKLGLSKGRELRNQWRRAYELLLAETDVGALSNQIELALFYEAKLVLT